MGCMTSSPTKEDDGSAPQRAGANGLDDGTNSKPIDNAELAKKQRRKLSVAPQHVGDITPSEAEALRRASIAATDPEAFAIMATDELSSAGQARSSGNLKHGFKTRKGVVPYNKNKVNQDRAVIRYHLRHNNNNNNSNNNNNNNTAPATANGDASSTTTSNSSNGSSSASSSSAESESLCLWGVMDGHGEFGHQVAAFVQEQLPLALSERADQLVTETEQGIFNGVRQVVDGLQQTHINVAFSGTTCVFGVKVGQSLYVANIGDSRCVMCRQLEPGSSSIAAIPLSVDQKPEHPVEKARIIAAGGRVEPLPGPPGEDCGPPRVWLAEVDVPGLAMSRSIGDEVSQTVGVISVPELVRHDIQPNDIFAIWASDGVWEFLSNEQAIAIVWKYRDNLQEAAAQLAEESAKMWKKEEEVIDDITCVIVQFNEPK